MRYDERGTLVLRVTARHGRWWLSLADETEGEMTSKAHTPARVARGDDGTWHPIRRPSPSALGGALFGSIMGSALGPLGAAAGMVIGGLAGEVVERHYDRERRRPENEPAA